MQFCVLFCSLLLLADSVRSYCPAGFVHNSTENSTDDTSCVCGRSLDGIIDCDQESGVARLAIGFCIYFDFDTNSTIVGRCQYNNNYTITDLGTVSLYVPLPDSVHQLEDFLCGEYNRHSRFCSSCGPTHKTSMISYSMDCIPCTHDHFERFAYIMLQVVPVTIMYGAILLFDVRFTKTPWSVFIPFCQIVVNMLRYDKHLYSNLVYTTEGDVVLSSVRKLVLAFYGIWNLDFIPNILPPFCLGISKDGSREHLLEYLVALYPPLLIAVLYFCVYLYSRDFRLIVYLCKIVKCYFEFCRLKKILKRITSKSISNSFSSFFVLAFSKVIFVSLDLLLPTKLFYLDGRDSFLALFYNTNYTYAHVSGLPYLFLCAILMLVLFTILPTMVIILYPFFSKCCTRTPLSVKLFVESFQGWFKDGTEQGTRDYRILAGLHPLLRIFLAVSIAVNIVFVRPASVLANNQWVVPGLVFLFCSLLYSVARPYKLPYMNQVESVVYALLSAISLLVSSHIGSCFAFILGAIPMLAFFGYTMYRAFKKLTRCYSQSSCITYGQCGHINTGLLGTNNFCADRLENPSNYEDKGAKILQSPGSSTSVPIAPPSSYGTFS